MSKLIQDGYQKLSCIWNRISQAMMVNSKLNCQKKLHQRQAVNEDKIAQQKPHSSEANQKQMQYLQSSSDAPISKWEDGENVTANSSLSLFTSPTPVPLTSHSSLPLQLISQHSRKLEKLQQPQEPKYPQILANANEGLFQTTVEGRYISANETLAKIYGYESPEALMSKISNIQQLYVEPNQRSQLNNFLQQCDAVSGFTSQVYRQDGAIIWITESLRAVRDENGKLLYYQGSVVDISNKQRTLTKQKSHQVIHDPLTGLSNRAWFLQQLGRCVKRAEIASASYKFAVLFLDLDRFKLINDSLGYSLGDQLLVALAERVKTCLQPTDEMARLGADEFAILLDDIQADLEVIQIAQTICAAVASPFLLGNDEIFTGVSIGIALSSIVGTCLPEEFLGYADIAMCHAKQLGKGRYTIFDTAMHERAIARFQLETALRQAIQEICTDRNAGVTPVVATGRHWQGRYYHAGNFTSHRVPRYLLQYRNLWQRALPQVAVLRNAAAPSLRQVSVASSMSRGEEMLLCSSANKASRLTTQLQLYYQPVISLSTYQLTGFEALLRWRHPKHGWISPSTFIPVAEETGLILPLGEWVLWQACRQLRHWQEQFPSTSPLTMSVNISCKQLSSPDLIKQISRILDTYNLASSSLKLEITETVLVENAESVKATLEQLKRLGIQLSIDDFGIGYSSLSRLHTFPIDTLKIDRSFISGKSNFNENSDIVQTIVALAHNLGMDVVAEGVETPSQLAQLKALHCEYAQGFLFSQPVESEAAGALMTQNP